MSEEKKLTDDVRTFVALFVEFDEMGFAPTTTCPNPEEYARDWKMAMLNKVHLLQSENKRLKNKVKQGLKDTKLEVSIRDKEIERLTEELEEKNTYEEKLNSMIDNLRDDISEQKAEIERLTEEKSFATRKMMESKAKAVELQKQVDELKKSQVVHIHIDEQFKKECEYEIQQAVKDMAKEIECAIRELFYIPFEGKTEKQKWQRKGMEDGLNMALEIVKGYTGVEVE